MKTLQERGLILKKGTIVDSTIIEAPSSTKNAEKKSDPDAHSVKKGNAWHFGYKAHIGVDKDSGIVHDVKVTGANVHDVTVMPDLLTGEEEEVYKNPANSIFTQSVYRLAGVFTSKMNRKAAAF